MKRHHFHHDKNVSGWAAWVTGLASLVWLLLRSGSNPRRLAYPCQQAAAASGLAFVGYLASVLGITQLYRVLKRNTTMGSVGLLGLTFVLVFSLTGSNVRRSSASVNSLAPLPSWTSLSAVSDVYAVENVPAPECSLASGSLPATAPCNDAAYALRDHGVDSLIDEMERQGELFHRNLSQPSGMIASGDIVVIKINNQWVMNGSGNVQGRLASNTDVLKGLIWRILQHPDGFTGEIVVAENIQDSGAGGWDSTPANSEDTDQSMQDVVATYSGLGYPVSITDWNPLNYSLISGGNVNAAGFPVGEYASGNMSDAYILLEDSGGNGTDELSYPKFETSGGARVSMRYGVWNGASYDSDALVFINLPVLKVHGMAGATIAWKNLIGFVTTFDHSTRYGGGGGSWDQMHDFFWGYTDGINKDYGLIGRQLALVRAPDLNLIDAIWVADDNYWASEVIRTNVLAASTDPFAVDWYVSEYVLRQSGLAAVWDSASAARAGEFRNSTRTNQNAAALVWSGAYPWMDLLDSYDGAIPSDDEKNQMNVYLAGSSVIFGDGFESGNTTAWSDNSP